MIAASEGYHVVSCESQQAAEKIQRYIGPQNALIASFFYEMCERIPEINILKTKVSLYASITPKKKTDLAPVSGKIIQIGLDVAKQMDFWKGILFLVENSHDALMYKLISLYEKEKDSSIKKIDISFNIVNGGGGNTHKEMERVNNGKCFVLCFLDSDKKHPGQKKYGSTAAEFKKKDITALSSFCIIKAHELENLFFTHEFTKILCSHDVHLKNVNDRVSTAERKSPDFRLFFDVKYGYLKKYALGVPYISNALNVSSFCKYKQASCSNCDECVEPEVGGFGGHFLDDIEKQYYCKGGSVKASFYNDAKSLNTLQKNEWERLGQILFSWGCSYELKSYGI